MKCLFCLAALSAAAIAWAESAARADPGWGTLRGKFVLEGEAPVPKPFPPSSDAFCVKSKPQDLSLQVDPAGGIANVVVMLRPALGDQPPVHPGYEAAKAQPVTIDNRCCSFNPRVVLVRTGQTLVLKNSDETTHNTNLALFENDGLNVVLAAGGEQRVVFDRPETAPMPVGCNVHPFMKGFVLIRDDPYAVASTESGEFEIANLPAGEHTFEFWHELGRLRGVEIADQQADRRGRIRLTVPDGGELDLGEIAVPAELFQ